MTSQTTIGVTEDDLPTLPTEDLPKVQEANGSHGDRVLANRILFLQDFGWWAEIAFAIPEDNIGYVFENLKVNLDFIFHGIDQALLVMSTC